MRNIAQLAHNAEILIARNSPAILTAIGVTGTVLTAYLTGKASVRADRALDAASADPKYFNGPNREYTARDIVEITWKEFIPPALVGTGTIAAIIMANRIGTRRTAAVTAAYAITERAYTEYRDKVVELHGEKKERKVRESIAKDRFETTTRGREIEAPTDGKILCMDAYSGRLFYSTVEDIKAAQNWINYELLNNMHASLTDFYGRVGLSRTDASDNVGWNCDKQLELLFDWGSTDDQKPCCIVSFADLPFPGYYKLH